MKITYISQIVFNSFRSHVTFMSQTIMISLLNYSSFFAGYGEIILVNHAKNFKYNERKRINQVCQQSFFRQNLHTIKNSSCKKIELSFYNRRFAETQKMNEYLRLVQFFKWIYHGLFSDHAPSRVPVNKMYFHFALQGFYMYHFNPPLSTGSSRKKLTPSLASNFDQKYII